MFSFGKVHTNVKMGHLNACQVPPNYLLNKLSFWTRDCAILNISLSSFLSVKETITLLQRPKYSTNQKSKLQGADNPTEDSGPSGWTIHSTLSSCDLNKPAGLLQMAMDCKFLCCIKPMLFNCPQLLPPPCSWRALKRVVSLVPTVQVCFNDHDHQ